MKDSSPELVLLFDLYGAVLTDKQRVLFDLYHNEDLSLAEIAENEGISRQGVRDAVIRAEKMLRDMEHKLGLQLRYGGLEQALGKIAESVGAAKQINAAGLLSVALDDKLREISDTVESVLSGLSANGDMR